MTTLSDQWRTVTRENVSQRFTAPSSPAVYIRTCEPAWQIHITSWERDYLFKTLHSRRKCRFYICTLNNSKKKHLLISLRKNTYSKARWLLNSVRVNIKRNSTNQILRHFVNQLHITPWTFSSMWAFNLSYLMSFFRYWYTTFPVIVVNYQDFEPPFYSS